MYLDLQGPHSYSGEELLMQLAWGPTLITSAHDLQMMALKMDRKQKSIKTKYVHRKKSKQWSVVVEVHKRVLSSSRLWLVLGKLVTRYKSHGPKTQLFKLPQGVFMDISSFMTLLERKDTDVWLAKEGGRVGGGGLQGGRLRPDLSPLTCCKESVKSHRNLCENTKTKKHHRAFIIKKCNWLTVTCRNQLLNSQRNSKEIWGACGYSWTQKQQQSWKTLWEYHSSINLTS